jgi:small nuclear ribonucleoprotein (snRNP)-like protein
MLEVLYPCCEALRRIIKIIFLYHYSNISLTNAQIMRYFPDNEKNKRGVELRERRDKYLNHLLDEVKKMIEAGTDKPCIASAIIKGDNERLNDGTYPTPFKSNEISGSWKHLPQPCIWRL